ncbi:hypothetical protein ACFC09_05775 [Streptomyces sp. NPDC056161]|uniref:hypothetical protein n=1 Tax=Streptomyces sp. NPDC056161 TaxID=3345732 RepID=UPI0035DDA4CD
MVSTLNQRFPNVEGTSMSYPDQGGADFEIYTASPPPQTASELVAELGVEAVRAAMPSEERRSFDGANPWSQIQDANADLAERIEEVNDFDARVQQTINTRGYTQDQAQVVYAQTADMRQSLIDAMQQSQQTASQRLNTYENNLINHIESRGLTQRVALRTGNYSTPDLNTAQAAAFYSPDLGSRDRRDRHGDQGGQGRTVLGNNRGDRRQPRGRR